MNESCKVCDDGYYKEVTEREKKSIKKCLLCRACENHVVVSPCNKTHGQICGKRCRDGYVDSGLGICVPVSSLYNFIFMCFAALLNCFFASFFLEFQTDSLQHLAHSISYTCEMEWANIGKDSEQKLERFFAEFKVNSVTFFERINRLPVL